MSVSVFAEGNHIKMFMRGRPITMFIPSDVDSYDDVRTELPPERLKLEWVYPSIMHQVGITYGSEESSHPSDLAPTRNCQIQKGGCRDGNVL